MTAIKSETVTVRIGPAVKAGLKAVVEQPAITLFSELGWETVNGFHEFDQTALLPFRNPTALDTAYFGDMLSHNGATMKAKSKRTEDHPFEMPTFPPKQRAGCPAAPQYRRPALGGLPSISATRAADSEARSCCALLPLCGQERELLGASFHSPRCNTFGDEFGEKVKRDL